MGLDPASLPEQEIGCRDEQIGQYGGDDQSDGWLASPLGSQNQQPQERDPEHRELGQEPCQIISLGPGIAGECQRGQTSDGARQHQEPSRLTVV